MVNFTILAGGYSAYITSYLFNTDDHSLSYVTQSLTAGNPSWITSHPTNKSILYATNENSPNGTIQSFTVGPHGALTMVDIIYTGSVPAYCTGLPTGEVGVANFGSFNARFFPTGDDHLHFSKDSDIVMFPKPTTGSQGVAEPHMIYPYGQEIFVPDKGNDKVWRLGEVDGNPGYYSIHGDIQQPIGSGPRHIRIRDKMLYALHQFSSTLTLQEVPCYPNDTSPILSNVSTAPSDAPKGSVFAAAEILLPNPTSEYPTPYVYTSNRNMAYNETRGDTIAIFENIDNKFVLRNQVYTGLNQIRGIMSGEDAGQGGEAYIVAAGVAGNAGVKVFKRTEGGANLEEVAVNTVVPNRGTFVWLYQEPSC